MGRGVAGRGVSIVGTRNRSVVVGDARTREGTGACIVCSRKRRRMYELWLAWVWSM